jgi:hypothetical protein
LARLARAQARNMSSLASRLRCLPNGFGRNLGHSFSIQRRKITWGGQTGRNSTD